MEKCTFAERLLRIRKSAHLTQKEMAEKIGISYQAYQTWEYGQHPNRKNLDKIVDVFGCSRSWLLTGEGEPCFKSGLNKDVRGPEESEWKGAIPSKAVNDIPPQYGDRKMSDFGNEQAPVFQGIDPDSLKAVIETIREFRSVRNEKEVSIDYEIALVLQKIYRVPFNRDDLLHFLEVLYKCGIVYRGKGVLLHANEYAKLLAWGGYNGKGG